MQKRVWKTYLASLILLLFFACGPQPAEIKIATYNIYWLDDGISDARQERLQTVMRELNADIIGFQEIQSKSALERILPDNYTIGRLDDPEELQELAIAVREPFEITDLKMVFPEKVHDHAFPRKRDLLQAYVDGYGRRLIVLVHHAKSRSGGRDKTNARREDSATMIMSYLTSRVKYDHIVLLGDFQRQSRRPLAQHSRKRQSRRTSRNRPGARCVFSTIHLRPCWIGTIVLMDTMISTKKSKAIPSIPWSRVPAQRTTNGGENPTILRKTSKSKRSFLTKTSYPKT